MASMRRAGYNGVKSKLVSAPCVGATSPESVEAMMNPRASTTHKRIARRRLDTPSVARRDPPSLVALRTARASHGHYGRTAFLPPPKALFTCNDSRSLT